VQGVSRDHRPGRSYNVPNSTAGDMTTADWALVISLCSVAVSLAGFVWNVWSKFIYPRAKEGQITHCNNADIRWGRQQPPENHLPFGY
jgi:hypothetical protein